MNSLIDELSTLTTIPVTSITNLADKSLWCICNCVEESKLGNNDLTEIDIGIGILSILVENNNIQYRFVPSKKLEAAVRDTIVNKKNPLTQAAESALTKRILEAYKSYI